jgi:hypothetical protein
MSHGTLNNLPQSSGFLEVVRFEANDDLCAIVKNET